MAKGSLISPDLLVDIPAENKGLCRMASASIRTALRLFKEGNVPVSHMARSTLCANGQSRSTH